MNKSELGQLSIQVARLLMLVWDYKKQTWFSKQRLWAEGLEENLYAKSFQIAAKDLSLGLQETNPSLTKEVLEALGVFKLQKKQRRQK